MHKSINDVFRLMGRRSRSGQSIIIIALGFIALIAFVGIATDTALLFVRFSTLRRATDAAAVAAAGQIRENSSYGNVAAAAQQYIKIHGLDPTSVKVETCETEIYDYIQKNGGPSVVSAVAAKTALIGHSELCRPDPAKLVRVSAQIQSPTTFLSIIGYKSILLSASSLSQTAVMDVALLLDGSLSEAYDTGTLIDSSTSAEMPALRGFAKNQLDNGFTLGLDPYDSSNPSGAATGAHPTGSIRWDCRRPSDADPDTGLGGVRSNYDWGGCCDDPTTQATSPTDINYNIDSITGVIKTSTILSGVPDNNYSDLVCHPFKEVRDATRRFLNKIDFVRGDRVMLVEFDSHINALTSAGVYNASTSTTLPVFNTRFDAISALNKYAGVEINNQGAASEPMRVAGRCITLSQYPYKQRQSFYETIAACPDTNTGGAIQTAQFLLTNPNWIRRDAVWITVILSDGYPNRTPGIGTIGGNTAWNPNFHKIPNPPTGPGQGKPSSDPNTPFFDNQLPGDTAVTDPGFCPWWTFCDPTAGVYFGVPYTANGSVAWNNAYCPATEQDNTPIWWASSGHGSERFYEAAFQRNPYCVDNNPDSRHFCMDVKNGVINPASHPEFCSKHYDPDDFARDRVDFAALTDYTSTMKGNFIAMFAIFFPHSAGGDINSYILGVKFMRYVADAGDNGIIDNHVQAWYRNAIQTNNANPDPIPPNSSFFNDLAGFNGADGSYGSTPEDPCAKYDFRELTANNSAGNHGPASSDYPDGSGYEDVYKTSCGNYYYAGNSGAIDRAFADIASRLFTRLAR